LKTPTLTVSKTGTGTGSVSSSPAGITCGGTCASSFDYGTVVTLTATPDAGSVFTGWSGGGARTALRGVGDARLPTAIVHPADLLADVSKTGTGPLVSSSPVGNNKSAERRARAATTARRTLSPRPRLGVPPFTGWRARPPGTGTAS
jgi:hypothetical protein